MRTIAKAVSFSFAREDLATLDGRTKPEIVRDRPDLREMQGLETRMKARLICEERGATLVMFTDASFEPAASPEAPRAVVPSNPIHIVQPRGSYRQPLGADDDLGR